MFPFALEFVVLGDDPIAARTVALDVGGRAYVDDRADARSLPFRTLVRAVTDRPALLNPAASIGRYLVCVRPKKVRPDGFDPEEGVVQINAMVTKPSLTPEESDRHWRDVHAPLALKHHVGMSQYTQLSVVQVLDGPVFGGFALCEFDSMDDLRNRFFDGPEGERAILADIASFADRDRSPRRLLARRV